MFRNLGRPHNSQSNNNNADQELLFAMIASMELGFTDQEIREAVKHEKTQERAVNWIFEQREKMKSFGGPVQNRNQHNASFGGGFGQNVDLDAIRRQHQFSYDSLSIIVKEYGFSVVPTENDGNCLFESLRHGYKKQAEKHGQKIKSHEDIRSAIFEHLQANQMEYKNYVENWDDFCTKLLTAGEWGGEIEIMCFARTFKVNVHVHQIEDYDKLTTRAEYKEGLFNIHLAHVNDLNPLENFGRNHYVLLDPEFENPAYSPVICGVKDEKAPHLAQEEEEIAGIDDFPASAPPHIPQIISDTDPTVDEKFSEPSQKDINNSSSNKSSISKILDEVQGPDSVDQDLAEAIDSHSPENPVRNESIVNQISDPEPLLSQSGEGSNVLAELHEESPLISKKQTILDEISDPEPNPMTQIPNSNLLDDIPQEAALHKKVNKDDPQVAEAIKNVPISTKLDSSMEPPIAAALNSKPIINSLNKSENVNIPPVSRGKSITESLAQNEDPSIEEAAKTSPITDALKDECPVSALSQEQRSSILEKIQPHENSDPPAQRESILDSLGAIPELLNSSDRRNVIDKMQENRKDPTQSLPLNPDPIEILPNPQPINRHQSDSREDDWEAIKVDEDVKKVGQIFQSKCSDSDEEWDVVGRPDDFAVI